MLEARHTKNRKLLTNTEPSRLDNVKSRTARNRRPGSRLPVQDKCKWRGAKQGELIMITAATFRHTFCLTMAWVLSTTVCHAGEPSELATLRLHHVRAEDAQAVAARLAKMVAAERVLLIPATNEVAVFATPSVHAMFADLIAAQEEDSTPPSPWEKNVAPPGSTHASATSPALQPPVAVDSESLDPAARPRNSSQRHQRATALPLPRGPVRIVLIKELGLLLILRKRSKFRKRRPAVAGPVGGCQDQVNPPGESIAESGNFVPAAAMCSACRTVTSLPRTCPESQATKKMRIATAVATVPLTVLLCIPVSAENWPTGADRTPTASLRVPGIPRPGARRRTLSGKSKFPAGELRRPPFGTKTSLSALMTKVKMGCSASIVKASRDGR